MQVEDAQLVAQCLEGDEKPFEELIRRYQGAVYATAYYYVGRYGVAEEVTQDTFWAAYRGLARKNATDELGSWLKGIACRTAANWLRRNGKRLRSETPLPARRAILLEDARVGPDAHAQRRERYEVVQEAVDRLPERYRLPVVLRYMQELSYDEIARYTGETRDEVRGILQRASKQLRDTLAGSDSSEKPEGERSWFRARE